MEEEEQQSISRLNQVVGGLSATVKYMGVMGRFVYRLFGALYQMKQKGYQGYQEIKQF